MIESDIEFEGEGVSFQPGDVLFAKLRPYLAKAWVAEFAGSAVGDFLVIRPTEGLLPKFLSYSFLTRGRIEEISSSVFGAKMPRVNWEFMRELEFSVPEASRQQSIIDFLDRETAEIDAFIADQQQLIELLTERRAATISHGVTKGLDPTAPMKDSGIEWLKGESIPSHWTVIRLGHLLRFKSGSAITSDSIEEVGRYPVFGGGGHRGFTDRFTNDGNYALVGRQGALCGNVRLATGKFFASEHALVSYPNLDCDPRWLVSMLTVMDLGQYSLSAAQPGLSAEVLEQKRTFYPPLAEQQKIAEEISRETSRIDSTIADARDAIALSRERRAALISAAVTGKIDVRTAARAS